jgi:hypothetical protein
MLGDKESKEINITEDKFYDSDNVVDSVSDTLDMMYPNNEPGEEINSLLND